MIGCEKALFNKKRWRSSLDLEQVELDILNGPQDMEMELIKAAQKIWSQFYGNIRDRQEIRCDTGSALKSDTAMDGPIESVVEFRRRRKAAVKKLLETADPVALQSNVSLEGFGDAVVAEGNFQDAKFKDKLLESFANNWQRPTLLKTETASVDPFAAAQ